MAASFDGTKPATRILFVTNDSWFFVSHRLPIAQHVLREGMSAHVAALEDGKSETIRKSGAGFHAWAMSPRGKSPLGELKSIWSLATIIRSVRPDVIHLITIKPVLYGGLLARLLRVQSCVYAVSGMGSVLTGKSTMAKLIRFPVRALYRTAIQHANSKIIFQNNDDKQALQTFLGLKQLQFVIIRGSGVDLTRHSVVSEPTGVPVVLMAARLLKDKGVFEYAQAASILRERGVSARFLLAGGNVAQGNPEALSGADMDDLANQGVLELLGHREDLPQLYREANLVVLPSYREGLPKVLIEAAAAARAVVTTDVPGCRDAIDAPHTGLLVPVRDAAALADAIELLLGDNERRKSMGLAGRRLAEEVFAIDRITSQHLQVYRSLTG